MEEDELRKILKEDIPQEIDIKCNSKELLSKCKQQSKDKNKVVLKISLVLSSFVVLLIAVFGIILIISKSPNSGNTNVLSVGFTNSEAQPSDWIGITSDQSTIKVGDNLITKVYYGTLNSYPDDYLKMFKYNDFLPNDVLVELVISYGVCTKDLLEKGDYTYTEPEYTINYTITSEDVFKVIEQFGADEYPRLGVNSKYDDIVIPSSYFNGNMGFIRFSICEYGVYDDFVDRNNSNGTSVSIYYVIAGDNITLYGDYNSFYNSVIK